MRIYIWGGGGGWLVTERVVFPGFGYITVFLRGKMQPAGCGDPEYGLSPDVCLAVRTHAVFVAGEGDCLAGGDCFA